MSQIGSLSEEYRKKVTREIEQLQTRVIQTLVPTILAFGLVTLAGVEKISYLSLGGAIAVLFTSSLYIATVSKKIFKKAAFLVVFDTARQATGQILYEEVNKRYRDKGGDLPIVNAETTAASAIYIVLSLTFFSVFFMEKRGELGFLAANTFLTAMLLGNCAILLLVYLKRGHTETIWTRVRDELNESQG